MIAFNGNGATELVPWAGRVAEREVWLTKNEGREG